MLAVETTRHPAPGGATGPPPLVSEELSALLLVPPASGDQQIKRQEAFGRRLTAARCHRGVSLEEIARATKVSASLLAALEQGDASRWPKGLFRRAFFREYAAAIGLPGDAHVSEFLQLFPDGEDHPTSVVPQAEAPAALRLMLAANPSWRIGRDRVRRELIDLIPILVLAIALAVWLGSSPATVAGIVGLCYVGRGVAMVRRQAASWRRRARGGPAS